MKIKEKTQERINKACDVSGLPEEILINIALVKGLEVLERHGVQLRITDTPPPLPLDLNPPNITLPIVGGEQALPAMEAPRKITI